MSEYRGYHGKALDFLKQNNIKVGDTVAITTDSEDTATIMPRFEHSDERHIAVKFKSGYNVGLEIDKIRKVHLVSTPEKPEVIEEEPKINPSLPKILLLSTGGTIASRVDYRTGSVTPVLSAKELNASVPELAKIANIEAEVLFSEYSENITPEHWVEIAKKLDSYANSDYRGVILAHGTDTMQYTAAFLSFALAGFPKPVVLVGSQRSSDRPSSDAALNLLGAARFVAELEVNGIFVAMHNGQSDDDIAIHLGTRVRKNHTSRRDAFETVGGDPAFIVSQNGILQNFKGRYFADAYNPKISINTSVALLKYHPGFDPNTIDHLIQNGCKAIIFEGTGLGHIGRTTYDSVKRAAQSQVFLGMTSQCIGGRVNMSVYESGRDLMHFGIVPLNDMLPEVALVKAMWACGNEKSVKDAMLKNIAAEFAE